MNKYPHDMFDDVPEDSARRGAYRGQEVDATKSNRATLIVALVGVLGLLIGCAMYILAPRTLAPGYTPLASNSASQSPSASPSQQENTGNQFGMVYNDGAYLGAASHAAGILTQAGYSIAQVANWQGTPVSTSTVFYGTVSTEEKARAVADALGISAVAADPSSDLAFVVVLAADYTGETGGTAQTQPAETQPAEATTAPPTTTTVPQIPGYTYDPASGLYIEDATGLGYTAEQINGG